MRLLVLLPVLLVCSVRAFASGSMPELSFNQALREILRRSTDIESQTDQLKQTEASGVTARTAFLPNLSLQLGRYINQDNLFLSRTTADSVNAVAKLNLFRFGADVKGWSAASEANDTETMKLADTILKTEQQGVTALVDEIQRLDESQVLSGIVKKEQELLRIGQERYNRGLMPEQEVDKVAVDMENASAKLADTQIQEAQARAALTALLGPASISPKWPWVSKLRELQANPRELKSVLGALSDLEKRPDIRAAEKNVQTQEDLTSERIRQALPSVDSSFTYSSYGLISSSYGYPFLDPNWTASITITIPVFDQLSGYSTARAQYFEKEKAEAALEAARRSALEDWSASRDAFKIALSTAIAREKTVRVSRKLYRDSLTRFRLGRIDANGLSLDETRLSDSELLATAGWAEAHLALARLCHARGLELQECF